MKMAAIRAALCAVFFSPLVAPGAEAVSRVVVAIRYLQIDGTSHSHLYLFDGKAGVVRQLTRDESGQDHNPAFAPGGERIIYQRKSRAGDRWRSIQINGKGDRLLDGAPAWLAKRPDKPSRFDYPESVPYPGGMRIYTASRAGEIVFKSPGGSSVLVLKDGGDQPADPRDPTWFPKVSWLREEGHDQDEAVEMLPIFSPAREKGESDFWTAPLPRGEVPHERQINEDGSVFGGSQECVMMVGKSPFLAVPPLCAAFFSQHRGSTDGVGRFALDLKARRLMELAPNGGSIVSLPKLPGFACICEQRYLSLGDGRTVNCNYLDLWDAEMRRIRFAENKPAQFHGASLFVVGESSRVISISEEE